MSSNPSAIDLFEKYTDKINWQYLSSNPNIFEFDYVKMAEQRILFILEDLMKNALHPLRIRRMLDLGMDIMDL